MIYCFGMYFCSAGTGTRGFGGYHSPFRLYAELDKLGEPEHTATMSFAVFGRDVADG
jgi:hypothetical protein